MSSSRYGGDKQSAVFGGRDNWIVKLDAGGTKLWDQSFGGIGDDSLDDVALVADGGFLIAGMSRGSGISGNKTTNGDGAWILRLDATGAKQAEWIRPLASPLDLLATPSGFSLIDVSGGAIANVTISTRIHVATRSVGRLYSVDVSSDLLNWTNLVNRFSGDLELIEELEPGNKFFRTVEME